MTDYDEVRTCCSGADICKKCWPFMTVALKILDRALREDFGFNHLLWVYSGRRGIHCWVCDKEARELSSAARSAIVEYLSVIKGGEYKAKKVHLPETLHPSLKQADKIISKYFEDLMLNKQDFLATQDNCEKIIAILNGKEFLKSSFKESKSSQEKWEIMNQIDDVVMQKGVKNRSKHFITEVKFQLCYPRLDINVTKGLNHLLKAPFCVHPKTGRVCVPIDVKTVDSFDPFSVPTISSLCREIDEYDASLKEVNKLEDIMDEGQKSIATKIEDYNKTSMRTSIEIFRKFVKNLV
ncbi:DNA primase small subunit [Araneus ventricosus]|uniref:DNA primase small subunit n=1 Tax=Araneus ventricosus TaxID=182803 RepID=A0A4Y2VRJ0_ARAVE|nr:DNA primase small subunit [Araneus ventricosus]